MRNTNKVSISVSTWPDGFAFILGFLAPLWVVGGFDSTVHIGEEARNASTAIPWAVVLSTATTCLLGWGMFHFRQFFQTDILYIRDQHIFIVQYGTGYECHSDE